MDKLIKMGFYKTIEPGHRINLKKQNLKIKIKKYFSKRKAIVMKSLFNVVLSCSIVMQNVAIMYYIYFWNNTFYRMLQRKGIASFISGSCHLTDT